MIIQVEKLNETYLRVWCEDIGIEQELVDYFTFEVPGAKFTPKYKARIWDGKIRLYSPLKKTLYVGLFEHLEKFAASRDCTIQGNENARDDISLEEVQTFCDNLKLHNGSEEIAIRDYQLDAIHTALCDKRSVLLSPTGSGKSLIIYCILRWQIDRMGRCLVVVPTKGLVEQMYSDFNAYSHKNGWDAANLCQKIYSGFPKQVESPVTISTWQSIYTQPKDWFSQFQVCIGDEAHLFRAKSMTSIMEKMDQTPYKIGTTGSLDNKKVHHLVLQGLFGSIHKVTTTSTLQKKGQLAKLKINALILKHNDEHRQLLARAKYQEEIDFLVQHEKRNKFITNLAASCKGNTLVLFQYVAKQGKPLHAMIQEKCPDRNVHLVYGDVSATDREEIRHKVQSDDSAVIVASYQTTSTGVNIPSISNIIFASPSKSVIRVLQSVGRGLRLNTNKSHCNLFDLNDDLHWKKWKNYTLKHGAERYAIYAKEDFPLELSEVNL